jgi:hypothetical protein
MAIGSFKLEKLSMLHVPFLFIVRHGSRKALLKAKLGGWFVRWQQQKRKCLMGWAKAGERSKTSPMQLAFAWSFPRDLSAAPAERKREPILAVVAVGDAEEC